MRLDSMKNATAMNVLGIRFHDQQVAPDGAAARNLHLM
jgi:hypothetical protein